LTDDQSVPKSPGMYQPTGAATYQDLLRFAAFHEAGHVLVAHALGIRIHYAILEGTRSVDNGITKMFVHGYTGLWLGGGCGSVEEALAAAQAPEMLRKRTVQSLAGQWAELLVNTNLDDVRSGAQDDYRRAEEFAFLATRTISDDAQVLADAMNAYLSKCHADCRSIVVSHSDTIEAIARCLYMRLNAKVDASTLVGVIDGR
jgi:hypothetical protein